MKKLTGKIAVVTGAARGMGQAFAVRLAAEGADVALLDILDCAETLSLLKQSGCRTFHQRTDLTDPAAVSAAAAAVAAELGQAQVLINNAALHPHPTPLEEITFAYWRKTMAINLDATFLCTMAFLPQMKSGGWGRIINLSSAAYNSAPPMGAPYVASKGGVLGLTRAAATELGKYGITVNAVSPNPVRTPGAEGGSVSEEMFQAIAAQQPIPRVIVPTDVAGVVAFLCSDDAAFITGQNIHVDGGAIRGD